MPQSEETAFMDLKETKLTLGLPDVKLSSNRGFSDTLDLNLVGACWNGIREEAHNDDNLNDNWSQSNAPKPPPTKAQLVGWPPVRASRKNAMTKGRRSKYVKVAVDGAPYLRKVDLESYNSYQRLSEALEDMFSCYTIRNFFNDGKLIMNSVNGFEYVPAYEDNDGDWMMVGDVPRKMFVESCKRIRLMKSSEAIELEAGTPSQVEQGN